MNVGPFATLTSRPPLATPGTAGLAAMVGTFTAVAKSNKNKRKKVNKKAKQKCQKQVDECLAALEGECAGDPTCLACCDFAGQCDFAGLVACVNDAQSGGEQ